MHGETTDVAAIFRKKNLYVLLLTNPAMPEVRSHFESPNGQVCIDSLIQGRPQLRPSPRQQN